MSPIQYIDLFSHFNFKMHFSSHAKSSFPSYFKMLVLSINETFLSEWYLIYFTLWKAILVDNRAKEMRRFIISGLSPPNIPLIHFQAYPVLTHRRRSLVTLSKKQDIIWMSHEPNWFRLPMNRITDDCITPSLANLWSCHSCWWDLMGTAAPPAEWWVQTPQI